MNKKKRDLRAGDWVVIQRMEKAHVGYIKSCEAELCLIAVVDMRDPTAHTPKEIISVPQSSISRLGELHWLITLDDKGRAFPVP